MIYSESYYQIILTYSELISNGIHTFIELLPNISKRVSESLNGHLENFQTETFPKNVRTVNIHT